SGGGGKLPPPPGAGPPPRGAAPPAPPGGGLSSPGRLPPPPPLPPPALPPPGRFPPAPAHPPPPHPPPPPPARPARLATRAGVGARGGTERDHCGGLLTFVTLASSRSPAIAAHDMVAVVRAKPKRPLRPTVTRPPVLPSRSWSRAIALRAASSADVPSPIASA